MVIVAVGMYAINAKAAPSTLAIQTSAIATTTVTYLVPGTASSTYQIDNNGVFAASKVPNMQGVDSVNDYVQYAASSTSAILSITPQWSNNNIDWYNFNQPAQSTPLANGAYVLGTSTVSYQFTPSSTATSSMVIKLPAIEGQHERVVYTVAGANAAVYSEYVLKFNTETP